MATGKENIDFAAIGDDLAKEASRQETREAQNRQLLQEAADRVAARDKGERIQDAILENTLARVGDQAGEKFANQLKGERIQNAILENTFERIGNQVGEKFANELKGERIQNAILENTFERIGDQVGEKFANELKGERIQDAINVHNGQQKGELIRDAIARNGTLLSPLEEGRNLDAMYRDPLYRDTVEAMKAKGYTFGDNPDSPNHRIAASAYDAAQLAGFSTVKDIAVGNPVIGADGKVDRNLFIFDGTQTVLGPKSAMVSENAAISASVQQHADRADDGRIKMHGADGLAAKNEVNAMADPAIETLAQGAIRR
jgi:hypothetical protein